MCCRAAFLTLVLTLLLTLTAGVLPAAASPASAHPAGNADRYVFPLAGPPELIAWERLHWDGGDEVDLEAAPGIAHGSAEMTRFEQLPVVAVTSGRVRRADNERGGIALILEGDDGYSYYYAHLADTVIAPGAPARTVRPGDPLGTIGRSGRWSQYLEAHLHFALTDGTGASVNAADWFVRNFGLPPITRVWPDYGPDWPTGPIVSSDSVMRVIEDFSAARARRADTAAVIIAATGTVRSPLTGEVRVMRNTIFGLRVQITNRHTDQTVVLSGLTDVRVRTGDAVNRGEILARVEQRGGTLNVMYFDRGRLSDPLPVMLVSAEEADHPGKKKN